MTFFFRVDYMHVVDQTSKTKTSKKIELKSLMKILLIIFLSGFIFISDGPKLSRESAKKLNKSIGELYPGHSVQFVKLNLSASEISDNEILNADGKWFAFQENGSCLGWMMADRIWGRYHEFEYVVFVDTSFKIIDVTVLSYPETHGIDVTDIKWLNKFNGFSPDSIPRYGKEIDAITGATISGTNLTESVAKSLKMLQKLHEQNLLQ